MNASSKIPMVDLRAQYDAHRAEFDAALSGCLAASSFIGGSDLKAFEEEFAAFCVASSSAAATALTPSNSLCARYSDWATAAAK